MASPASDDYDFVPAAGRTYKKRGRPKKRPIGRPSGPNFPDGITAPAGYCPANLELSRLITDGTSNDVGPLSSRSRKCPDLYEDAGAQTRLQASVVPASCLDDVAEILASLGCEVVEDSDNLSRTTDQKNHYRPD
jgi:hypothetical protein